MQRPLGGLVIVLPLITPVCVPKLSDLEGMETRICWDYASVCLLEAVSMIPKTLHLLGFLSEAVCF